MPDDIMWHVYNRFTLIFFSWLALKPAQKPFRIMQEYRPISLLPFKKESRKGRIGKAVLGQDGSENSVITCFREEKQTLQTRNILIDDNRTHTRMERVGVSGTFQRICILHTSAEERFEYEITRFVTSPQVAGELNSELMTMPLRPGKPGRWSCEITLNYQS